MARDTYEQDQEFIAAAREAAYDSLLQDCRDAWDNGRFDEAMGDVPLASSEARADVAFAMDDSDDRASELLIGLGVELVCEAVHYAPNPDLIINLLNDWLLRNNSTVPLALA